MNTSTTLRAALTALGLGTALLLLSACGEPTEEQPASQDQQGSISPMEQPTAGTVMTG